MKRLFVAANLPIDAKAAIIQVSNGIDQARWEHAEMLHLTLRFIGDADETATTNLQAALGKIQASNVQLELTGVGAFPTAGRARILWAGLAENPQLIKLQRDIETAVQACGFPAEERAWKPHITLARFRRPPGPELQQWLTARQSFRLGPFNLGEFHLFESQLQTDGAVHTKLQTFALAQS